MLVLRLAEVVRRFASKRRLRPVARCRALAAVGRPSGFATVNSVIAGLALVALSLPRGRRSVERHGGWHRFVDCGRIG